MTRARAELLVEDLFSQCQHWQDRYRPAGEPFHVDIAEYRDAKPLIEAHHYAASYVGRPGGRSGFGSWVY